MTQFVDINELHRSFWAERRTDIEALLAKPHLVAIVATREAEKARFVKLAISEADRIERIRNQKSFECELENVAEELASLPVIKAQQRRAKKPRGRVTDDGKTLPQIVETLLAKPESRVLSAPELWSHLYAELDQLDLDPREINPGNLKQAAYTYQFNNKRKPITYRRFANRVSEFRKKSR
jgi:hypothetical protein